MRLGGDEDEGRAWARWMVIGFYLKERGSHWELEWRGDQVLVQFGNATVVWVRAPWGQVVGVGRK